MNDTVTPKWKYVRDVARDPTYAAELGEYGKVAPFIDIYSNDMRCGRDAGSGPKTSVATVLAGTELGFRIAGDIENGDVEITHEGPGQVYLSRAPNNDVQNYDGSGDWFKIAEEGVLDDNTWLLYQQKEMRFILPETTPPGKYLMRIEHLVPTAQFNSSQWYVNCAQIEIVGKGGGSPGEMVKFPGAYDLFDYGMRIPLRNFPII